MAINEQWNIRSRAHACHITGEPFQEGETFITALYLEKDGSLERQDFSLPGWEAREDGAPEPFSSWRSVYVPPVHEVKVEPLKKESAEELLRRLIEEDEPHTENVRFILAVMLERQKILRMADQNRIGATRLLVYEHKRSGDVLIVRDPEIPLAEVDTIQAEVVALLEQGLGPKKDAAPEETTPAPAEGEASATPETEAVEAEGPATEAPRASDDAAADSDSSDLPDPAESGSPEA